MTEMEKIEQVIENFKISRGLKAMHVSLGPDATAETVQGQLEVIFQQEDQINKLPETVRLKAHIAWLNQRLTEIAELGKMSYSEFLSAPENLRELKHKINLLTDVIPDIDTKFTLDYARRLGYDVD